MKRNATVLSFLAVAAGVSIGQTTLPGADSLDIAEAKSRKVAISVVLQEKAERIGKLRKLEKEATTAPATAPSIQVAAAPIPIIKDTAFKNYVESLPMELHPKERDDEISRTTATARNQWYAENIVDKKVRFTSGKIVAIAGGNMRITKKDTIFGVLTVIDINLKYDETNPKFNRLQESSYIACIGVLNKITVSPLIHDNEAQK